MFPGFYLAKLLWPDQLIFIYPRWTLDSSVGWQWLFPFATLALTVALWLLSKKWRAPLAGWLFFVGTLFPVLGFFNVYPFIYSFVADHFQYRPAGNYRACSGRFDFSGKSPGTITANRALNTRLLAARVDLCRTAGRFGRT